jgi:hypothetical protein
MNDLIHFSLPGSALWRSTTGMRCDSLVSCLADAAIVQKHARLPGRISKQEIYAAINILADI